MIEKPGLARMYSEPKSIEISRVTWLETGLDAYKITLNTVDSIVTVATGETITMVNHKVLDYHWQENVAWECAARWSKRYGVPII